eukprot:TRINITY_DN10367_c0_g1_i3.p3 TRINITY_DN10367_c0_g1~~TRINITY_DN10367_c0_g1_i3.p3  ORF type:complete len:126 (-),score=28.55 TRINITY_DN10367_c0_g1_i3:933-1310(-)
MAPEYFDRKTHVLAFVGRNKATGIWVRLFRVQRVKAGEKEHELVIHAIDELSKIQKEIGVTPVHLGHFMTATTDNTNSQSGADNGSVANLEKERKKRCEADGIDLSTNRQLVRVPRRDHGEGARS